MSEPHLRADFASLQLLLIRVDRTWLEVVKSRNGPQVVQREALDAHAAAMQEVRTWLSAQARRQLDMFR